MYLHPTTAETLRKLITQLEVMETFYKQHHWHADAAKVRQAIDAARVELAKGAN